MLDRYELAGWALDFEGSISLHRSHETRTGVTRYGGSVSVTNTKIKLLHKLAQSLGFGRVSPEPSFAANLSWNDKYRWRMSFDEIREHLPMISPYLCLKQRQAEIVLEGMALKLGASSSVAAREEHYTPAIYSKLEALYQECLALNTSSKPVHSEQESFYRLLRRR